MEKPRPSIKVGKFTAINPAFSSSGRASANSWSLSSQGAVSPPRRRSSSRASQRASGISTRPCGISSSAPISCQLSSTMALPLISFGIDCLLERVDADALEGVEKGLLRLAPVHIDLEDFGDHIGHVLLVEGGPQHAAQAGLLAGAAAELDLVELLAFLVHPQNPDIAHVVVAAGVHAAGNIEGQVPQVVQVIEVVETALDILGHRNRLGVGKGAEVAAGAAD